MIYGIVALIIGFACLHYLLQGKKEVKKQDFSLKEKEALKDFESWKQRKHEDYLQQQKNLEDYELLMKESFQQIEKIIQEKEARVEQRLERNQKIQNQELSLAEELELLWDQFQNLQKEELAFYLKKTGSSIESLKEKIMQDLEHLILENKEMRQDAILQEYQEDVPKHAQSALQLAMQRLTVPSSVDKNHTFVSVRYDAFKGMLAGKEGKNIRYLESKIPVFVVFNQPDTESIYVGGLNLFRRHIAKKAIEKLQFVTKGQGIITHEMIDEAIESAEKDMMQLCDKKGAWACEKMGIDPESIPPVLLNYMGRLNYRTSYGQNIIYHSLEMAFAARMLAEMIGTDAQTAMLGAFYHDIGKAIDHDIGGSHDDISKDILQIHGFSDELIRAVYCHHDKVECEAPADYLVKAVDAISGGRPGARMESVFNYFDRIKQLEDAALAVEGIQKVFTMSAGREVRAMVDREKVKDESMQEIADGIAKNISEGVAFPGIIKVNVIRKTKAVDYAKEQKTR